MSTNTDLVEWLAMKARVSNDWIGAFEPGLAYQVLVSDDFGGSWEGIGVWYALWRSVPMNEARAQKWQDEQERKNAKDDWQDQYGQYDPNDERFGEYERYLNLDDFVEHHGSDGRYFQRYPVSRKAVRKLQRTLWGGPVSPGRKKLAEHLRKGIREILSNAVEGEEGELAFAHLKRVLAALDWFLRDIVAGTA